MLIYTMMPTDSITLDDAILVLDSISFKGTDQGRCMYFKLIQDNKESVIPLYEKEESVINVNDIPVTVHADKVRSTCGKLYFHNNNTIKPHYNKGLR